MQTQCAREANTLYAACAMQRQIAEYIHFGPKFAFATYVYLPFRCDAVLAPFKFLSPSEHYFSRL